jgi:hypothetical protein
MKDTNTGHVPEILSGEEAFKFAEKQYIGSPELVGNIALCAVISKQSELPDVSVAIYDVFRENI